MGFVPQFEDGEFVTSEKLLWFTDLVLRTDSVYRPAPEPRPCPDK